MQRGRLPSNNARLWRIITLLSGLLIFSLILPYPFCSDVSIQQWIAKRLVVDGALPFVGSWDNNFPGILLFHSLGILLFGNSELGFRIIEAAFHLSVMVFFYQWLLRWLTPRAAFISAFFFALTMTQWGIFYLGVKDLFIAGLLLLALGIFDRNDRWPSICISSLLFGLALLIRPLFLPLPLTLLLLYWRKLGIPKTVGFFLGLALPGLLTFIPYVVTGTVRNYYEATILWNLSPYQSFSAPFADFAGKLRDASYLLLPAAAALLPPHWFGTRDRLNEIVMQRPDKRQLRLYFLLIAEAFAIFALQRKFLPYHIAPFLALICPLAGVGLERLSGMITQTHISRLVLAITVALLFLFVSPILPVSHYILRGDISHLMPFANDPLIGLGAEQAVEDYLSQPKNARGAIEVVAYDARLRNRLDRPEATRFTMVHALTIGNKDGSYPPFQQAWRSEFLADIVRAPARFIIVGTPWGFWNLPPLGKNLSHQLPALDSLLRSNYRLDTTFGGYEIFRLNQ